METKEIIESGFVKAFIAEYFEFKIHSFYPDKDRLLYVLCNTELEKQQVTAKQIEFIKSEIQKLGNEELSFAYLLSCKPESISRHNYIEPEKRLEFWLNRFCEEFIDSTNTFTPIIEACKLFETKISDEDFENEFWEMYPASQKPKEICLPFVIQRESELLNEIEYTISEHKENEYWEFDFEEYQKFIDISKPIELLFNVSELLVQLHRLEMFNEFLLPPQQNETKTEQETIEMKPVLKPEAVQMVFDILKDFFIPEQQTELKQIIETGNNASKKLLFKGNGNRLADTFKKLIEHDFITGCQKQDLINWIISNFTFTQQNKVKAFVYDTVEKTISRNYYPCKSPLIEIKNGQIQRFEQPRTKKYR